MVGIFISLESAILDELKNVFISIVALLLSKFWTSLWFNHLLRNKEVAFFSSIFNRNSSSLTLKIT